MIDTMQALQPQKQSLNIVGAKELLEMTLPERELLLAPWLPVQGLAMVYAPRGVGKTYFGLSVAHAVATSGSFLGWQAPKPATVLYLDGEMPANTMQHRLSEISRGMGEIGEAHSLELFTPDLQQDGAIPDLSRAEGQLALEPYLEGVDLVIVDNISTLCRSGLENESDSWTPVQQWALRLRARRTSVLFIHHAGKAGQQRGTSKREDVLDTVINLKRPAGYTPDQGAAFEVHFEKCRGFAGDDAAPLAVALDNETEGQLWRWSKLESSTFRKVVNLLSEGLSQAEIARELDVARSTVSRHTTRARAEGLIK